MKRREYMKCLEVLRQINTRQNGQMEWEEFVEFFRQADLLINFETRPQLNDEQFLPRRESFLRITEEVLRQIKRDQQPTAPVQDIGLLKRDESDEPAEPGNCPMGSVDDEVLVT